MFNLKNYFIDALEETSAYLLSSNLFIGLAVLIGLSAPFFFNLHQLAQHPKLLILFILNFIVILPLFLSQFWINKIHLLFQWYSLFLLSYISFFVFFTCLQNTFSDLWALFTLTGLIIIILLTHTWLIAVFSITSGLVSAVFFTYLFNHAVISVTNYLTELAGSDSIAMYTFLLIGTGLLNFKKNASFYRKINLFKALSGSIVHEIATPLSCINLDAGQIIAMAEQWQNHINNHSHNYRSQPSKDPQYTYLQTIKESAQSIEHMVMQTQTIARIQLTNIRGIQRKNKEPKETLFMVETINEVLKDYAYITQGITIIFNANSNFEVQAIKTLFTFVLLNLLKNAAYALKHKNNRLIEIWLDADKRQVYFKDYGTGIAQTKISKLFTSFNTSKVYGEGTGLGLFFCKQVMTNLGGHIKCHSKINRYTQFTLSFPKLNPK